jgi:hypothetical protein
MKACEVTPDGENVFDMYAYGASTYRSHRFEWQGKSRVPYFILENDGKVLNLIFNKFGDKEVDYYKIYHDLSPRPTTVLDTTSNTYYQAVSLANKTRHYFRIAAVDVNGNESDFSEQLDTFVDYPQAGENIVDNGEFESDEAWTLYTANGAYGVGSVNADGEFAVQIKDPGSSPTDLQLYQDGLMVVRDKTYVLEFDAYAYAARPIGLYVGQSSAPFADYSEIGSVALSMRKKRFSYTFTMKNNTDPNTRISFQCGQYEDRVILDNVSLMEKITSVEDPTLEMPTTFYLAQNYPNPFNPKTTIEYQIPEMSHVTITVYNVLGETIEKIVDESVAAGHHRLTLDASTWPAGICFYELQATSMHGHSMFNQVRKMTVIK